MTTRIDQFSSPAAADGGSGAGEVNVWIVGDDEEVIVIDPGTDAAGVLDAVGDREVLAVICTHGHADHVAAAIEVAERDEAPWRCTRRTGCCGGRRIRTRKPTSRWRTAASSRSPTSSSRSSTRPATPPGSVCLYCEDLGAVFTGHVLLAEGPAPQDDEFPDFAGQLTAIGENLLTLPADTRVLPGHGPETTIAVAEKKFDSWFSDGPGPPVQPRRLGIRWSSWASRGCRGGSTRARRPGSPPGWTARAGTG